MPPLSYTIVARFHGNLGESETCEVSVGRGTPAHDTWRVNLVCDGGTMTRIRIARVLVVVLLAGGCSSDGGSKDGLVTGDGPVIQKEKGGGSEVSIPKVEGIKTEKGTPPADGPKIEALPPSLPGTVCTQQNKTCPAGQMCVFLSGYGAAKGTCVIKLPDACKSYDDPRCTITGASYGWMCGPYSENSVTSYVCMLLCQDQGGTKYSCPPNHDCKVINSFNVCVPQ
jgi:hypothetical protein